MAITAETAMKKTMRRRIVRSFLFSDMPLFVAGEITSSVSVELETRTSDESVDIEAERTRTMTIAITMPLRFESMDGTIISK